MSSFHLPVLFAIIFFMENIEFQEIKYEDFVELNQEIKQVDFIQSVEMASLLRIRELDLYYFIGRVDSEVKMLAMMTAAQVAGGKKFELKFAPTFYSGKFEAELFFDFMGYLKSFAKKHNGIILKVVPAVNQRKVYDDGSQKELETYGISHKMKGLGFVKTNPEIGYDEGEPTWHYLKDLSKLHSESELLKSFSKDGQYSFKKTKQFGVEVRKLTYEELSEFKKVTEATSIRRGYRDHDLAYYQSFYKIFGDRAQFLVAEINFQTYVDALNSQIEKLQRLIDSSDSVKKEKQRNEWQSQIRSQEKRLKEIQPFLARYADQSIILAASLFVESSDEVVYLFSGSYDEFKMFYAPYAIQYKIMTEAIEKDIPLYNFYGITGNFDGTDGVLMFKQNFKGYSVQKVGSFTYYPYPGKYRLIALAKKILRRN